MDCVALIPNKFWLVCWLCFFIYYVFVYSSDLYFCNCLLLEQSINFICLSFLTLFLFLSSVYQLQIMKSEVLRVTHELQAMKDKIKENSEKIKVNKTLPYLVSNVIEVRVVGFYILTWEVFAIYSGRQEGRELILHSRPGVFSDYQCCQSQDFQVFLLFSFVIWKCTPLSQLFSGSFLRLWVLLICT